VDLETLKDIIEKNLENKSCEIKRLFHGRGNFYDGFNFLTVDSIDKILFASFFEKVDEEKQIINILEKIAKNFHFETFIVQRRYEEKAPSDLIFGNVENEEIVIENGLKYSISFLNKNIGIFPDMKIGRKFVKDVAKDKNILNLFSYTCAFSVCAIEGGAKQVVNVDMSKGALTTGRRNHHLNNHNTKKVKFMPYNILKSWSRIKKFAPYDLIIIDPPSFQKGSFAASKDYVKIVKKLDSLSSNNCTLLACLNAPELDTNYLKELFKEHCPSFIYKKSLDNLDTFPSLNKEKSLKNLIFERV